MSKHVFHGEAYRLLGQRDVPGFADYMANACRQPLTHGLGSGEQVFRALSEGPDSEPYQANSLILIDRLAALAEAIGALPYENPEQGRYGVNVSLPIDELVGSIQNKLGVEIFRPKVMGLFGLEYRGHVIDFRAVEDAYCVHWLKSVDYGKPLTHMAEIGGGIGGMAFQAIRADVPRFTIFDLPIICLVQGFFLMKVYGGDAIRLFGENIDDRKMNVLPYWEFFNRSRQFDAVFNRDSLPEIPLARAEEYMQEIADRQIPLLSINQEGMAPGGQNKLIQLNINALARRYRGLRCAERHPYWMRKGYVQEIYRPTGNK